MVQSFPEDLDGSDLRVAIAVARFNTLITERLHCQVLHTHSVLRELSDL